MAHGPAANLWGSSILRMQPMPAKTNEEALHRRLKDGKRFSKLTLLKKSSSPCREAPHGDTLETFSNMFSSRPYEITFETHEFTSLCPVTGQPDFGEIQIRYVPRRYCIESKSLKLYLHAFRNFNVFHEEAVNMILDAVVRKTAPAWAEVTGRFRPRGGVAITVKAEHGRHELK
mgnify:CR=1 FL=1